MSLHADRRPSARAQGLNNKIVPGTLMSKCSVPRGQRKEGGKGKLTPASIGIPEVNDPAWNTGTDGNEGSAAVDDMAEAKAKEVNLQLPHVDLPEPKMDSEKPEAAPPAENASLLEHVSEGCSAINLTLILKNVYANDQLFRKVLSNPKEFRNFEIRDNLIFIKLEDRELLCIPDHVHKG
ncbi:hypothetical protein IW261DRAFT_1576437 [Armillaria novae-zelandiae]|uniref:Uncharacterized protein n=1 Tax=Armillaria novae-zelandiae TaxID=153914 RepID=A0AA39TPS3_9AGAR|nr:hypothetical protein IW261DRAFT_1576437 [Armillaria novae-zelandiae]